MSLDLLIVNPAASHGLYGPLGDSLIAVEPPIWARILAAYVRKRGFTVQIIDAEAERMPISHIAARAKNLRPRLIAIVAFGHQPSASTQQMYGASQAALQLCGISDLIMIGGHVAALPEQTLREESITFACNGEGPLTLLGLLENKPLPEVPGLVWIDDGILRQNPRAELPPVSELAGDAWDLLPMHLYRAHNWQCFGDLGSRQPYASIYTTFNCPYQCTFCCISAPFGNNRYLRRDPTEVVAEIKMLHDRYGVRTLKIADEMFILTPSHYTAIAQGLIDEGLGDKMNIWAYARVDTVKPETLGLLRKAGFRWLALGIESGSKFVRDGADKILRNDDIVGVVRAIQEADINVIGNYIFGLPDDTLASMQKTMELALECRTEFANFYSCMAYPGSKLYEEAVMSGVALPPSWKAYSQHNEDSFPLSTLHVSNRVVLKFRDEAFNAYFRDPDYLAMIEKKFGSETLAHVKAMTTYKLKRKLLEHA